MLLIFCIGLFVAITAAISIYGYSQFVKPGQMLQQLADSTAPISNTQLPGDLERERLPLRGLSKLISSLGQLLPSSPQEMKITGRELTAAGINAPYAPSIYVGSKVLVCGVMLMLALIFRGDLTNNPLGRLLIPVGAGAAGYLAPSLCLGRLIKRRQQQIKLGLPDALDLLVISTEAGCALDKAILSVSKEFKTFHPAISEELGLVNMEMLAGSSRVEALRNFARRTNEDEVKKLVAILVQTDRFGTSVAEALRTQSDFMRSKRKQEAEEKAGKVGVKLVFPIFFFCMPALVILVAGPGMLQLFKNLIPALGAI